MADLNTKIRGEQIKDASITASELATDAVETLKIKDANVTLAKLESGADKQLVIVGAGGVPAYQDMSGDVTIGNTGITAIGATKVLDSMINDDVATGLAGTGLSASTGVMAVDLQEVAEVAITVADDYVVLLDGGISGATKKEKWADIITAIAGSGLTATSGVLSADAITDNIIEADILFEDESTNCNGSQTAFTLASSPVANSVMVFLNGLIQQEGSGKDYTISGTTITFATAPASGDILLVHYLRND